MNGFGKFSTDVGHGGGSSSGGSGGGGGANAYRAFFQRIRYGNNANMNQSLTATGITSTAEATMLDDNSSGRTSLYESASSAATTSLRSSTPNIELEGKVRVYNYKLREFENYPASVCCEKICTRMCRELGILPITQLLFGIRLHDADKNKWILPGEKLKSSERYCFRMRFKVPELDTQLQQIDANCHEYLYYQMRYDMQHEDIPEIRYPNKKSNVVGLAVYDMAIDMLVMRDTPDKIEKNYKLYLPRKLFREHRPFIKSTVCGTFRQIRSKPLHLGILIWNYVHEIYTLAPKYLMEQFRAIVDHLPDETSISLSNSYLPSAHTSTTTLATTTTTTASNATLATSTSGTLENDRLSLNGGYNRIGMPVYVKLSLHDALEPGLKIATIAAEEKLKWILVTKIEDIYSLYEENDNTVRLEINGYPKGYRMRFDNEYELQSFIGYLGGYIRLTTKWMLDLCVNYITPSLYELKKLRCHGPIGGSYSFAKIREKRDELGAYIVRQCEKEYDTYYIDINTKSTGHQGERDRYKTETFQIKRDLDKWILNYNGFMQRFDQLTDVAQSISTDSDKFRIPPSEYDKPPLLLICLPKNLHSKKTETELSETELLRKRAQIFDPKKDLQCYITSDRPCDDGKMLTMRADWIQQGSFKDVPVTLKVLNSPTDFPEFMKLANTWSFITSQQFIKLYGLTLSTPYTMVMEYSKYGPLNDFLYKRRTEISMACLLDVMHGFVRGMHYLQDNGLIHSYIRCSNMYVTKYEPNCHVLEAKINDPGYPRPYRNEDLPWIPFEHYNDIQSAKNDPNTQLWAFATTVWEIFARGRPIGIRTVEQLMENFKRYGGILELLDKSLCPEDIFLTIMDGWSFEPDKRFNHQVIFARLNAIKNQLSTNYTDVETISVSSNTYGETPLYNGGSDADFSISNQTLSNNSTVPFISVSGPSLNGTIDNANGNHDVAAVNGHNDFGAVGGAVGGVAAGAGAGAGDSVSQQMLQFVNRYYFPDTPSVLQIADGKVIYKEKDKIGQGHYGTVYRGEIRYHDCRRPPEQVAIKKLRSYQMKKLNDDFLREIKIMQALDHPNIVKFKYWIDDPFSIIMEYFEYGSFTVYLSSRKPNLTNEKLLQFALDIAEGMNYLRNKEVIHRDLAARNILVDRDCVKISDFGLAQMADSDGYYIACSVREIPIKWYSPESIKTSKFSFQSDVWSYGVTLFEMFSRGEIPNLVPGRELTQEEILNMLESGERLRQPAECPDLVYQKLMRPCWHENPKMRPTFKQLIEIIKGESGESI